MTKGTNYSTVVTEQSDQMSDVQFLFNKYEVAIQEVSHLSKKLENLQFHYDEDIKMMDELRNRIEDLEYDIRDTRNAVNMTISECLDEDNALKPTNKVTKQDLLDALQTISVLING